MSAAYCAAILLLQGCTALDLSSVLTKLQNLAVGSHRSQYAMKPAFVFPSSASMGQNCGIDRHDWLAPQRRPDQNLFYKMERTTQPASFLSSLSMKFIRPQPIKKSMKAFGKVLVLNASYEPLSIVSTRRALSLLWANKASVVVANEKMLKSCSGSEVQVPSVVCLRRFIKPHPKMPALNRRTVLMRDGGRCQYCGKRAENVDHVLPRCRGGGTSWDNVVASCSPCNTRKAGFLLKDTNLRLRKAPGLPGHVSWVYAAVSKVDDRWKPYIGEPSLDFEADPAHNKGAIEIPSKRRRKDSSGADAGGAHAAAAAAPKAQPHQKRTPRRSGVDQAADSAIAMYSHSAQQKQQ